MGNTISIGIDCAPGAPRPDSYMTKIYKLLGITGSYRPVSTLFGAWSWNIPIEMTVAEAKPLLTQIEDYLTSLYHAGSIRGAEWSLNEGNEDTVSEYMTTTTTADDIQAEAGKAVQDAHTSGRIISEVTEITASNIIPDNVEETNAFKE